jgi:hypothetical protein
MMADDWSQAIGLYVWHVCCLLLGGRSGDEVVIELHPDTPVDGWIDDVQNRESTRVISWGHSTKYYWFLSN